jgi:serine/threonine-protein kinase
VTGEASTWTGGELFAGRYELGPGPLGQGEFGEVWPAFDQKRGHQVALKLLHTTDEIADRLVKNSAGDLQESYDPVADSAWQEAGLLTSLESPNILRVNNADMAVDVPYIDSVLATRGTVHDAMRPLGMPQARAIHLTRGLLRALQLCHDHGLLHRDVKPSNVFIGPTGDAQLGDFGCAGRMDDKGTAKAVGDPSIRPLDVLKGQRASVAADVYGAGITLYAMLTGEQPFPRDPTEDFKAFRDRVAGGMPDIRLVAPHVGLSLAKAVRTATAAKAADRFATAGDFSDALARLRPMKTDASRIAPADADVATHLEHERCWRVVRRSDSATAYVCVTRSARKFDVTVTRFKGQAHRELTKNALLAASTRTHLNRVFEALR